MKNSFATAINYIDGRVQLPLTKYLKREYNVDYVDMTTESESTMNGAYIKLILMIETAKRI